MPETIRGRRVKDVPVEATSPEPPPERVKMADWLGVDEVSMRTIDLKVGLMNAIRLNRAAAGLTQAALAKRLGVARPRIAEMEAFRPEVSLDALIPAFFASGGTTEQLCQIVRRTDKSMSY